MSIPEIAFIVALIIACIDQIRARGQALTTWAVILVCVGLLWGALR